MTKIEKYVTCQGKRLIKFVTWQVAYLFVFHEPVYSIFFNKLMFLCQTKQIYLYF